MYLLDSDESFTHQIALPHALVGSSDPSWRERYWISMQDVVSRELVVSVGMGQYPNHDVFEGFVVISDGRRQHNLRLARPLSAQHGSLAVGPLSISVDTPYRDLHIVLGDNPSGVTLDVHWLGALAPILEEPHLEVHGSRVTHDVIRYVQHGRVTGVLRTPEGEHQLTPETWWGERDHSWGTRPLPQMIGAPPGQRPNWAGLLFAPIQFPDWGFHLYLYEDAQGRTQHLSAAIRGRWGSSETPLRVLAVEHDLHWDASAAALTLSGGAISLHLSDGTTRVVQIHAEKGRAHLRGGGYEGWNGWLQGHWKGDESMEHEVWDLTDPENAYRYAKAGSDHLVTAKWGDHQGYGVVEYMVLPDHERYGFALPRRRD